MRLTSICILCCFTFLSSLSHSQVSGVVSSGNEQVIYQFPRDGDTYINESSNLIVRLAPELVNGRSANEFSFIVHGEKSGLHPGKVVMSADNVTLIFIPTDYFELNENVSVTFLVNSSESVIHSFRYHFKVTHLGTQDRLTRITAAAILDKNEKLSALLEANTISSPNQQSEILKDSIVFPVITIDTFITEKVAPGRIFVGPNGNNGVKFALLAILDNAGKPIFSRPILPIGCEDFKIQNNRNPTYFRVDTVLPGDVLRGKSMVLNSQLEIIDSFECGNGYVADSHDFQLLPNGHALLFAIDPRDTDMVLVTGDPQALHHATVLGAVIQEIEEIDKKKTVVFQWRSWDHFKITDATHSNLRGPLIDYQHINSIERDPTDGNLIASFRAMDEVTKINRKNGQIIWRWGGKNNYFKFSGDTLQFSHQHDVRRIANGHITMWDNGNFRKTIWPDGSYHDTAYSRGIEYDLDEGALTSAAVWQFGNIAFSAAGGNMQRLPNGNTLMCLGLTSSPNALEVTVAGEKVFQISFPIGTFNYRAFRFEWPLSSVTGNSQSLPQIELASIFPNPASISTEISLRLVRNGHAEVELIDVMGRSVRKVRAQVDEPGDHVFTLGLEGISSGVYSCRMTNANGSLTKMLVVSK